MCTYQLVHLSGIMYRTLKGVKADFCNNWALNLLLDLPQTLH